MGVVMDFERIAASRHMGFANAPGGAWIVAIGQPAGAGVIGLDPEALKLPQPNHRLNGGQIPVQLIAHGGIHGPLSHHRNGGPAGPAAEALGIGMARHHQDWRVGGHGSQTLPILVEP